MKYADFLVQKALVDPSSGIEPPSLNPQLYPFQAEIVTWALRRGRAAIFCDCGMGKTPMQLEWARHIPGRVLILTPLAVAQQTVREARKFGVEGVRYCRDDSEATGARIIVTNYEMLDHFDADDFTGVVLDESSILKAYDGKTRTRIIEAFRQTPFRLACTATPAPNDFMELGNHSEFLGAMTRTEMLSMFFVHDGGSTQDWRLKGHARQDFWRWVASWAVLLRRPSDLGYDDDAFTLPPIAYSQHVAQVDAAAVGQLFPVEAATLQERLAARRESVEARAGILADVVGRTPGAWVVWCNLNAEADAFCAALPEAVEVRGTDDAADKERALLAFADGSTRVLVTKPSIAGFGMNWQHCHNVAFLGLSDSWEQFYQAVRRCWRFGQESPVDVHIVTASTEGAVLANIMRKEADAAEMAEQMTAMMRETMRENVKGTQRTAAEYRRTTYSGERFTVHKGDCVDVLTDTGTDSIDYAIFSPPFASLYTYSNSDRDMGNCADMDQFMGHFDFAVRELARVLVPGRLTSVHCMNLPTSKVRDGVIGLRDFRGEIVRLFESHGLIFHSEVCIWKDPVTAMQRTKALGLLHKQIRKDSAMSRQGIPDYLVTFRKPGDNPKPIAHTADEFPVSMWQRYASPVWMDINPSDTLQYRSAREHDDEKHICPLQLDVIRRAMTIWTRDGDLVLDPFAGIGSTGVVALEHGRRFVGVELKDSYWRQAVANLRSAESQAPLSLFA